MDGLGNRITTRRKELGLSQKELGSMCNVGQATISSWEKERTEPNMGNIHDLCKALEIDFKELIYGTYTPKEIDNMIADIAMILKTECSERSLEIIKKIVVLPEDKLEALALLIK